MTKNLLFLLVFLTAIGLGSVQAQCTPDPIASQLGIPGYYPNPLLGPLPSGNVGDPYDVTITAVIPSDTTIDLTPFGIPFTQTVGINYLLVNTISGLPMGLTFGNCDTVTCAWPGGGAGCFKITGTPTEAGSFTPGINVTINVDIPGLGPTNLPAFDMATYDMDIAGVNAIDPSLDANFDLAQNVPNPFTGMTAIEFETPNPGEFTFEVVDLIGHTIHKETLRARPGNNVVNFDGSNLAPGLYLYRLHDGKAVITRNMMVSK